MRDARADDPADLIIAWEAVEELLRAVPDGATRTVLRLVAAGLPTDEIARRLRQPEEHVQTLVARGRIRLLTAATANRLGGGDGEPDSSHG